MRQKRVRQPSKPRTLPCPRNCGKFFVSVRGTKCHMHIHYREDRLIHLHGRADSCVRSTSLPKSQRRDPEQVARARHETEEAAKQRTKDMSLISGLEDGYVLEDGDVKLRVLQTGQQRPRHLPKKVRHRLFACHPL